MMTKYEFLIELVHAYQPLFNISTVRYPFELLHHFKYMHLASTTNQIYFPTPKKTSYDACLFDKSTKEPSLLLEYKFRTSETSCFNSAYLQKWVNKYGLEGSNIDKIDIGFKHEEIFHNQSKILSHFVPKNPEHICFELTDFSSFFCPQSLTGDFEKTAETLFLNHSHMKLELCELGEKLLLSL